MASAKDRLPWDISLKVEQERPSYDPSKYEGGVYSDLEILEALAEGHIRIFPFEPENLKGTSYDTRLGEWYYRTDRLGDSTRYNFYNPSDVQRYFGEPQRAVPNAEWARDHNELPWEGIPDDHPIIVLRPGERILAHTHEFIGILPPGTTQMQTRSTYGRNGIVTCKDAGWGDPGYRGRWTMEIQNDNTERVALPVGIRAAQIVFLRSGPTTTNYGESSKYYTTGSLEDDLANWRPDMMLPKAFKDEIKPLIPLTPGTEIQLR